MNEPIRATQLRPGRFPAGGRDSKGCPQPCLPGGQSVPGARRNGREKFDDDQFALPALPGCGPNTRPSPWPRGLRNSMSWLRSG